MQSGGIRERARARHLLALLLACLTGLCTPLHAQPGAHALNAAERADLARLIDEVIITQLYLYDIPGAAVALVGNGRILHLGGYGYADRDSGRPVDADRTVFGAGSVAKVFTATAVMQLVGTGKLSLGRDVNDYLTGLQLPATWPRPVTLADLLTQSAGFEERAFGFYARSPAELTSLQMFLATHMPARVYPPGKVTAYSNYGIALAGQIVAQAAGMPFERYIDNAVFAPLGMQHSSFRQPLPAALEADLATGYRGAQGRSGRSWYQARPSGALHTTAADMARFMLALLQQGRYGKGRILAPPENAAMLQRQFSNNPAVNGLTYGFQELTRAGERILWHPGDTRYFTAAVFLLPERGLGLFIAHNRAGTRAAQLDLLDAVLSRLQPLPQWPQPAAAGDSLPPGTRLDGSYRSTRSGVFDLERLFAPLRPVTVRTVAPGALHITGLSMVPDGTWIERAPGVYQDSGSEETVVFSRDAASGETWLFERNVPAYGYHRLPWYASPAAQGTLLAGCALVFFLVVLLRPPRSRTARPVVPQPVPWTARVARPLAGLLGATNLTILAGTALILSQGSRLLYGIPPYARAILLLPLASAALAAMTVVLTAIAWSRGYWNRGARWQLTLVALAGLAFLGVLRYQLLL
ncbi:MAG: serine hydrolase domain-containing protein [Pseudomonadota bacterium]